LGAKDGKLAVKLEGIGTNDFAAVFLGEGERDLRFADGGRAGEEDGVLEDVAFGHRGKGSGKVGASATEEETTGAGGGAATGNVASASPPTEPARRTSGPLVPTSEKQHGPA
jgi:hypothetical protein